MNKIILVRNFQRALTQKCVARSMATDTGIMEVPRGTVLRPVTTDGVMSKEELNARRTENDNPFETYMIKPDAGTGMDPKKPIMIPSEGDSRIIGCSCESDYKEVVWFKVEKGGVHKCDCGYYFKLIHHDPMDESIKPFYGSGLGSGQSQYNRGRLLH